jgi:peptidoglycan/LPS O-acetylase OafA/YrhL
MIETSTQDASQPLKLSYVPVLDGLRVAVLGVVFVHLESMCPLLVGHHFIRLLLYERNWYGLNIFFCLSGFLITWLLAVEIQKTGNLNLIRFYKRRTVRLLPAYLTAMVVAALLARVWGYSFGEILRDSASFLTYSYNLFVASDGVKFAPALALFLLPAWSLCVEEQFYFVWSLAFKWLKMKYALSAVVWSVILLSVYRWALFFEMNHAGRSFEDVFQRFYFGTDTRIHAILIGCAAALALQNRRYYAAARKYLTAKPLPYVLPIIIAAIVFLTARHGEPSLQYQLYGAVTSLILLTAWIVCLVFQPASLVTRTLSTRPFRFIGRISYGIFIFHFLVIRIVMRAFEVPNSPYSVSRNVATWFLVAIISTLFAAAHYYLIELPLQSRYKSAVKVPASPEASDLLAPSRQRPVNISLTPTQR